MGMVFTQASDISAFTEGDIIELIAPSSAIILLHELHVGTQTETDDSSTLKLSRHSAAGSGGNTTGLTPTPHEVGFSAFGGTYREAATTDAAGTVTNLGRWKFSTLLGFDKIWTPETRIVVPPSGRIVLNMEDALTSVLLEWSWTFEVVG